MNDALHGKKVYLLTKRLLDLMFSFLGLLLLLPFLLLISLLIFFDSKGPVLFVQERLGKAEKPFLMLKFRTMYRNAHAGGLITIGNRDGRITRTGYYLRKYKMDEWPQLWNILKGDMSFVGPRPEVPRYVSGLNEEMKRYFLIRPGLTSYTALVYMDINEQLARSEHPEKTYREEIIPRKAQLNLKYMDEMGFWTDARILFQTILLLFKRIR